MLRKLWTILLALALPLASGLPCPAGIQDRTEKRDWKKNPAIIEVDTKHDIYAVGDPHGDYERLLGVLVAARIVPADPGPPEKIQWQAGQAVLVCTGDLMNKWDQSLRVIALFRSLQAEAARAGGRVVVTMGNHEAEFLADPTAKKVADFANELRRQGVNPKEVAAGTDPAGVGMWLRSLPVGARVNDWFFAHAGNTHGRTLAQLRADLEKGIDQQGFAASVLQNADSILLARMHPEPWWEEPGFTAAQSKANLAKCVLALGVRHLVIGHQPGKIQFADGTVRKAGTLFQQFDGLIFLIDTGMSRGVGSSAGEVLHVHQGQDRVQASRIPSSGKRVEIWSGAK